MYNLGDEVSYLPNSNRPSQEKIIVGIIYKENPVYATFYLLVNKNIIYSSMFSVSDAYVHKIFDNFPDWNVDFIGSINDYYGQNVCIVAEKYVYKTYWQMIMSVYKRFFKG